jgi:hypothetical protein
LANQRANVVPFLRWVAMVKIQYSEIAKATVHAFGVPKEFPQPFTISGSCELVIGRSPRFIARRIAEVVRPRKLSNASAASSQAVIAVGVLEPELGYLLSLTASRALPGFIWDR